MKLFSVKGITQSGKTTTIECIIRKLRERGYSVASVKEIHFEEFAIDTQGSNTDRHKKAGSQLVTARGYNETDILYQEKLPIHKIIDIYNDEYDYLVLEGVSDANVPMILTAHNTQELDERWNEYVFAVSGKISSQIKEYRGVPCIDATANIDELVNLIERKTFERLPSFLKECCTACGYSCAELGAAILNGKAKREDCIISQSNVSLKVDEKEILMVPFVQRLLRNAVLGVVKELDGCKSGSKIEVSFRVDKV